MRDAYFAALTELGREDERVWALTGDLGIGLFDPFQQAAPGRYLNVGIAEQNLVGVAAGLSYAGKVPFAYSIAPFITSRPHDQVRVDVALPAANVKLVGVGGGVAYGTLGPTHHAIEDLAIMRALPNMTVLAPGDPRDAYNATRWAFRHDGPVYLRLGKNGEPEAVPPGSPFGPAVVLERGGDVVLLSTGAILPEAVVAVERLRARGIDAGLIHFGSVKPIDATAILDAATCGALVTVEEHTIVGGFGSAVAEVLAEAGTGARLRRIGLRDEFAHAVGSRAHLINHYGAGADAIGEAARQLVTERSRKR